MFKGYWRMPEKTAEEFTADGWFKTGDVGKVRSFCSCLDGPFCSDGPVTTGALWEKAPAARSAAGA